MTDSHPDARDKTRRDEVLREIPGRENDPTLMRNQPALRSSQGRVWIVAGAIFALISLIVFVPLIATQPVLAWAGILVALGLFAAMIVVRFTVRNHRARMLALATLLLLTAVSGLVIVVLISMSEWAPILG
ncbi:MAG TPA: hypothetical protein PK781_09445 [Terrimesophilobacter sp.]|nr:hypothetical protein [Terrimesophilobacter sp.]HRQ00671.1 hypothetical protein [Terrimesophilobacter sp.]